MTTQDVEVAEPKKALTPAEYNTLIAGAQLREIRLVKSDFALAASGIGDKKQWKLSVECEIRQAMYDREKAILMVSVDADGHCVRGRKNVLSAKCKYIMVYTVLGEPTEAAVDAFAKRVARFAAYPYFRAHFAQLVSQAGVEMPPLPVIKETKIIHKLTQEQNKALTNGSAVDVEK